MKASASCCNAVISYYAREVANTEMWATSVTVEIFKTVRCVADSVSKLQYLQIRQAALRGPLSPESN